MNKIILMLYKIISTCKETNIKLKMNTIRQVVCIKCTTILKHIKEKEGGKALLTAHFTVNMCIYI